MAFLMEQLGQTMPPVRRMLWQCDLFFAWRLILVVVALAILTWFSAARLVDARLVYELLALMFQAISPPGAAA